MRYAVRTLFGPWLALPVLLLEAVTFAQRGAPWRGEAVWTVDWFALALFVIAPLCAGVAAVDAARLCTSGRVHLVVAVPRPGRVFLRAGAWTAVLDGPRMSLVPGRVANATSAILADADTLAAIAEGVQSGIDAFLDGRLRIRGNMALALKLDGFDHPAKPIRMPRARVVRALGIDTFYLEAGRGPAVVLRRQNSAPT